LAISPPGDIVMDVARAADPAAAQAARARLASLASQRVEHASFPAAGMAATGSARVPTGQVSPAGDAFQKFEAVVLQTFIQTMLPKDTESVYGNGMAGEMWQSLLAQQLGETMAERGGIGIANRILSDHYRSQGNPVGESTAHDAAAKRADQETQQMLSVALVQEIQRKTTQSLGEEHASTPSVTSSR
jgi:flagellar protein FlgJ